MLCNRVVTELEEEFRERRGKGPVEEVLLMNLEEEEHEGS